MQSRPPRMPYRALVGPALVVVGVPLVMLGVAVWLRPTVPDQIATHWGLDGRPDGYGSPLGAPIFAAAAGVVCGVLLLPVRLVADSAARRFLVGLLAWLPALLAAVGVAMMAPQSTRFGAEPGAPAGALPGWAMLGAFVVSLACALAAAAMLPGRTHVRAQSRPDPGLPRWSGPLPSPPVWRGRARPGSGAWLVGAVPAVFVAALLWASVAAGGSITDFLGLVVFLVAVDALVAGMLFVRVSADEQGLAVRPDLPLLRHLRRLVLRVPLAEIESADVVDVQAFGDFGGWGYRMGRGGRTGFVLRSGPAVQVRRADGSIFVVTVDGAAEAAGLLNSLIDRQRT